MSLLSRLRRAERGVINGHRTPRAVQRWLHTLPYNWERAGRTLRSFRGVVRDRTAHCLEAALAAATILEQHGYPPVLLDLESQDCLDHVVFVFQRRGRWGAVGVSRDVGLAGRRPVYATLHALARSYYAPYIDERARLTGYALADLRGLGTYDWRLSTRNVWRVERYLVGLPHRPLVSSDRRYVRLRDRYRQFVAHHDPRGTPFTGGRRHWM